MKSEKDVFLSGIIFYAKAYMYSTIFPPLPEFRAEIFITNFSKIR